MSFGNPSSSHLPTHSAPCFLCFHAHSTNPWLVMSQGTSDSSSGSRGELPSQAGVGHSQTAKRGGRCWAGAGQETHQAAPATATAAAQCGKEGPSVPDWQAVAEVQQEKSLDSSRQGCLSSPLFSCSNTSVPLLQLTRVGRVLDSKSDASQFSLHSNTDYGFCHVSHWLWVISTLQCMTPFWDTQDCTVQPPFTAWCIFGNASIRFLVMGWSLSHMASSSEDCISSGLTMLIIDG